MKADHEGAMRALAAARAAYAIGRYAEALECLDALDIKTLPPPMLQHWQGLRTTVHYSMRRFDLAAQGAQSLIALDPLDASAWLSLAQARTRMGRPAGEVLPLLRRAQALGATSHILLDSLAGILAQTGDLPAALSHGAESLRLKDREAHAKPLVGALRRTQAPPFRPDQPERNIIAFSLWGDNPRYTQGAQVNARQAKSVYPGWTCRFYVDDTVPPPVIAGLRVLGCQIVHMKRPRFPEEGMFWRFAVSDDPGVDRFLVRDADCELGERERRAVEAWITSGRLFHAMRDHPAHTELMLGGLWGGVGGALPPMKELLAGFPLDHHAVLDQVFLRQRVWPLAKPSILVHDSHYREWGAEPFPAGAENLPGRHVGGGFLRNAVQVSTTSI